MIKIPDNAANSSGLTHIKRFIEGKRLTQRQAILANCCICSGFYIDGRIDCSNASCPFYPFMPYNITKGKMKKSNSRNSIPIKLITDENKNT